MTLQDIAASEPYRAQLADALKHPAIAVALQALAEDNLPALEVKVLTPNMSAMEAIALDAARRAGAQSMITRLKRLPYISNQRLQQAQVLGRPWEYLEPKADETPSTPKKLRKPTPTAS